MIRLNFKTISPLHISNGNELALNIDYVLKNDKFCKLDRIELSRFLAKQNVFNFSKEYSIDSMRKIIEQNTHAFPTKCFEYIIPVNNDFVEHIKNEKAIGKKHALEFINSNRLFYIPGSSIKGALLTILHLDELGIQNRIEEKFVIHDSDPIDYKNFSVYRAHRPPPINLVCIRPNVSFSVSILKRGLLDINKLKEKLSGYSKNQLLKAEESITNFRKRVERSKGADQYLLFLEWIKKNQSTGEEYLINLGYGGGSWYKIFNDVLPPKKRNKQTKLDEEAHTTFAVNINNIPMQLGWCTLTIES